MKVDMDWFLRIMAIGAILALCIFQMSELELVGWQFALAITVISALGGFTGAFDWFKSWVEARRK